MKVDYMNYLKIPYGKINHLLEFSMAYHHDMDGPSEIKEMTIKVLLKAYHREVELRYQWAKTLSMVAYAYFNTIQRTKNKHH